jgi:hypothetical protein
MLVDWDDDGLSREVQLLGSLSHGAVCLAMAMYTGECDG